MHPSLAGSSSALGRSGHDASRKTALGDDRHDKDRQEIDRRHGHHVSAQNLKPGDQLRNADRHGFSRRRA